MRIWVDACWSFDSRHSTLTNFSWFFHTDTIYDICLSCVYIHAIATVSLWPRPLITDRSTSCLRQTLPTWISVSTLGCCGTLRTGYAHAFAISIEHPIIGRLGITPSTVASMPHALTAVGCINCMSTTWTPPVCAMCDVREWVISIRGKGNRANLKVCVNTYPSKQLHLPDTSSQVPSLEHSKLPLVPFTERLMLTWPLR